MFGPLLAVYLVISVPAIHPISKKKMHFKILVYSFANFIVEIFLNAEAISHRIPFAEYKYMGTERRSY
jgi:hypothetical protein